MSDPDPDPIAELREGLLEIAVVGPVRARGAAPEIAAPWMVAAQSAYAAAVLLNRLALSDPKAAAEDAAALNGPAVENFAHKCAVGARFYGLPVDEWIADAKEAPAAPSVEITRYEVAGLYVEKNPRNGLWAVHDGDFGFSPHGWQGPGRFWGAEYPDAQDAIDLAKKLAPMVAKGHSGGAR
ncbi:hypothetical protein ACWGIB_27615 [Streptomyces xiamenensis]